jgi:adenosylmethionine-8-amino-7-oxononanoate aminotransferase
MNTAKSLVRDSYQQPDRSMWHPMTAPSTSVPTSFAPTTDLMLVEGKGVFVFDDAGKRYFDCSAGMWNVIVGHGRTEINRAIAAQLERIAYHTTFGNLSNLPATQLAERLMSLLQEEGMCHVMFSSGGSDAVETAFKLARQYWLLEGQGRKTKIISLRNGYHGLHFGGMSAGGSAHWKAPYEPGVPGFLQVEGPYLYRNPWTDDEETLSEICAGILEREIEHQGPDSVAAFIAEPVQGAGGLIIPPSTYWPRVREICDKHQVLLIADEVITGFGRTGSLFGCRHWGVKPDIMCLAKGINSGYIPMGATVVNDRVASAWSRDHRLASIMHGYTYSGHPVASAAALANLDIVLREDLPGNAKEQGAKLLAMLTQSLAHCEHVGDVRGLGLMVAIEFVEDRKTKKPIQASDPRIVSFARGCLHAGLLIRMQAHRLYLSPPLIISADETSEMASLLHTEIEKVFH